LGNLPYAVDAMRSKLSLSLFIAVFFISVGACDKVERPGTIENAKLATLFNEQLEQFGTGSWWTGPGMNGTQRDGARAWLNEVAEISSVYVRTSTAKFSHFEMEIKLRDGSTVHQRSSSSGGSSMVVRIEFNKGLAARAWTDGSEKQRDLDTAKTQLRGVIDTLIRADLERNRNRYFKPSPTGKSTTEISNEWK
jgi:hypothetical protein